MKKKLTVLMTILTCASAGASVNKVIYGEDDRTHLNDSELAIFKELARATAGMIPNTKLEKKFDGLLTLVKGETCCLPIVIG